MLEKVKQMFLFLFFFFGGTADDDTPPPFDLFNSFTVAKRHTVDGHPVVHFSEYFFEHKSPQRFGYNSVFLHLKN